MRQLRTGLLLALVPALLASACGKDSKNDTSAGSGGKKQSFQITLTADGCEPRRMSAQTGPATFKVVNESDGKVTEFEILSGKRIVGEVENIIPGGDRSFSLTLKAGTYTTYCPGAKTDKGTLEVAAAGTGKTGDA